MYFKVEDDIIIMDWMFSFIFNDIVDMIFCQFKNKVNFKVVFEIRIGKVMVSKGLDVIVEDMVFSGLMCFKIKLQIFFFYVEKIEMFFLERLIIDYVCKFFGGEMFGFDINFIFGLEIFIMEQIYGIFVLMMYVFNVFFIEVVKMFVGIFVDQVIGVFVVIFYGV